MTDIPQLISARTLASVHRLQARLMPDQAVILTPAGTIDDGQGGTLPGTPTESSAIPCRARARQAQASETGSGPQLVAISDWTVTLLGHWTVTPDQQLRVTFYDPETGDAVGTTLFEVSNPPSAESFNTETAVECKVVSSSGS